MTDIVERLRDKVPMIWGDEGFMITDDDTVLATFKEAADEIEKLRDALQEIANIKISHEDGVNKYIVFKARTIARIAIGVTNYE